jgi:hypothetical protein
MSRLSLSRNSQEILRMEDGATGAADRKDGAGASPSPPSLHLSASTWVSLCSTPVLRHEIEGCRELGQRQFELLDHRDVEHRLLFPHWQQRVEAAQRLAQRAP